MKQTNNSKKTRITILVFVVLFFFFSPRTEALTTYFMDNWDADGWGGNFDAISWVENSCPLSGVSGGTQYVLMGVLGNNFPVDAYCLNTNRQSDSGYDVCFIKNSASATNCSGISFPAPTIITLSESSSTWAESFDLYSNGDIYTDTPICDGEAGNTMVFSNKGAKRAQISYYCRSPSNGTCHPCGSTANDDTQNYFIVDKMLLTCQSDGSDFLNLDGQFATNTYISISTALSCYSLGGNQNGYICDAGHDETTSTNKDVLPANPCRKESGMSCTASIECWHDASCSGARTDYDGYCNGNNVILETIPYTNSCGGSGNLGTITNDAPGSTCQSKGFPFGYVCDPTYEYIARSTSNAVYNDICRARFGASCSVNSDCINGLNCIAGFCAYDSFSVFTDNSTDQKLYKNQYLSFDASLSGSSDNNIQYACWRYNNNIDKCYGNSSQCTSECGVASSNSNWATIYTKQFTTSGTIPIKLITGSKNKYSTNYTQNYCVSGDTTYCWNCADNLKNDDETDVDWGGHCGTPYFAKCNNNRLDNVTFETSIDYGGFCGNCISNSTPENDDDWFFLKGADMIVLPFNQTQCPKSAEIQGGVVSFVLIITALLFVPLILLGIILIGYILYYLIIIGLFLYRAYKTIKKVEEKLK